MEIVMNNFNEYMTDLKKLISYKSVLEPAQENAPFGQAIKETLHFFLERARDMGFETINYDNYAGEVTLGNGEEIGIIGHLDVVPIGIGWETDPFTLTEKDGVTMAEDFLTIKLHFYLAFTHLKN